MGVTPLVPLTIAMQGASSIAGWMAARAKAKGERQMAENNAFISETRARQTAAGAGDQLNSEMATFKATLAANGQGLNGGTLPFLRELARTRGREARIGVANERQTGADWRMQGRTAMSEGRAAMIQGVLGAGPSLFRLNEYRKGPTY